MMRTTLPCKSLVGLVLVASAAGNVRAQNSIDPLVTQADLSQTEIATIEVWVTTKAGKIANSSTEKEIKKNEDDFIGIVTKSKPSPKFAEVYANKCADQLGPVTGQQTGNPLDQLRALAAARILYRLDHPGTAVGLAEALRSPHDSVRYLAAKSIQGLHAQLKNQNDADPILTALGEAATKETSNLVLPELYRAIDFKKHNNLMAGALAKAFAGRATRLGDGARDEAIDQIGLDAAVSLTDDFTATNRKALALATMSLMTQAVERRLDAQANDTQLKVLDKLIPSEEEVVSKLVIAAKKTPPSDRVSEKFSAAKPDVKAIRETLAKWQAAAAGL